MSESMPAMVTAFERIARRAADYAANTSRVVDKPTSDEVRLIIETVFFASLAREEGRPLRLRVGFVAPDGPSRPVTQSWGWWVLPFENTLSFERHELVKLAPSVDSRQSLVAVARCDAGLRIWGVINLGASNVDLHEGRTTRATKMGPDIVEVAAFAPGELDVGVGSWSTRFADGRDDHVLVYPFRNQDCDPLSDIIARGSDLARVTPGLWARTLRLLIGEIQNARHGGTLFLHAGSERSWSDDGLRMKCRVNGEGLVLTDACHRASCREDTFNHDHARMVTEGTMPLEFPPLTAADANRIVRESSSDPHSEWMDAVRWVASLAAIDGALLLNWSFGVWAFGVIVESVTQGEIIHASNAAEGDWNPFPSNRFGTRHQSAAAFCRSHRTSAAVVVSQDGVITLFRWRGGRVVMWRPCEIVDPGLRIVSTQPGQT